MRDFNEIKIFTIGFKEKSAEEFFGLLDKSDIKRIVDIRISNNKIFAGFTIKRNLPYFLKKILNVDYIEKKQLAPTIELRDKYFSDKDWEFYRRNFLSLMNTRDASNIFNPEDLDGGVLLCSEPSPEFCHRRLVAEYYKKLWSKFDAKIFHL